MRRQDGGRRREVGQDFVVAPAFMIVGSRPVLKQPRIHQNIAIAELDPAIHGAAPPELQDRESFRPHLGFTAIGTFEGAARWITGSSPVMTLLWEGTVH